MRRSPSMLVLGALAVFPLAACQSAHGGRDTGAGTVPATAGPGASDIRARFLIDSAAARLAALELRRLALRARYEDWAPPVQAVKEQIERIERQLADLPGREAAWEHALERVLAGFDQREAGLKLERDSLLVSWAPDSPPVKRVDAEMRYLAERREEVQVLRSQTAERR